MDALKRFSNMLVGSPVSSPSTSTAAPHAQGHINPGATESSEQSIARQLGVKLTGRSKAKAAAAAAAAANAASLSGATIAGSSSSAGSASGSFGQHPGYQQASSDMNRHHHSGFQTQKQIHQINIPPVNPQMPRYPGLERYRLVGKMGDGAFSTVYRAFDLRGPLGEVAIKVVHKRNMSPTQHGNVRKEVQIMRSIQHGNIVRLLEFSESDDNYFIVLELCPGGELFHQIVRLTYFSEDLSRHVITQVAHALEYLHEVAGVVHRDIKPENLLFYPVPFTPTRNPGRPKPGEEDKADEGEFTAGAGSGGIGQVKVADFGLSKVVWNASTMTPCGTMGYTAPEIVRDKRYSKSVDMWALGCVLYTLLCGFPPFYDESIEALTDKVAKGQFTFLSPWWDDISPQAKDLVSRLLTVDPNRRYDIRQFLSHPWIRNEPGMVKDLAGTARHRVRGSDFVLPSEISIMHDPASHSGDIRPLDFRSPGVINLREVFDVGYALHLEGEEARMEEQLRQQAATRPRESDGDFYSAAVAGYAPLAGSSSSSPITVPGTGADENAGSDGSIVSAAVRTSAAATAADFRLSLAKSSLIERRKGRGPGGGLPPSGLRHQVVQSDD